MAGTWIRTCPDGKACCCSVPNRPVELETGKKQFTMQFISARGNQKKQLQSLSPRRQSVSLIMVEVTSHRHRSPCESRWDHQICQSFCQSSPINKKIMMYSIVHFIHRIKKFHAINVTLKLSFSLSVLVWKFKDTDADSFMFIYYLKNVSVLCCLSCSVRKKVQCVFY